MASLPENDFNLNTSFARSLCLRQAWTDHTFFFSGRFFSIWVYLVDVIWHKNKSEEGKN